MRFVALALLLASLSFAADPKPDPDAKPLEMPKVEFTGLPEKDAQEVHLKGAAVATIDEHGINWGVQVRDAAQGEVWVMIHLPAAVDLDVKDRDLEIDYRHTLGFEGRATGLRISDSDGIVLLVDDGQYGNALRAKEPEPFAISQEDAGCRNRKNEPGDLNNFWLVVKAGEASVKLMQGQTGELKWKERTYTVIAIQCTARVDNVTWTDAPYEYVAYAIVRQPKK